MQGTFELVNTCDELGEFGKVRRDGAIRPCAKCHCRPRTKRGRVCRRCQHLRAIVHAKKRHDREEAAEAAATAQAAAELEAYWPLWEFRQRTLEVLDRRWAQYWDSLDISSST